MARLDWNRDGRDDLAIGHLDSATVLLTNRSAGEGRYVALEFRGVTSSRDAIGTRVELHYGDQVTYHQLVAGDGYQASNERRLVMGVGMASEVDQIVINWPSGLRQTLNQVPTNSAWLAIEGRPAAMRLSK